MVDDAGSRNSKWKYIEVIDGNEPPSVYAGEDQSVFIDENIVLGGFVTDDGLPNPPGAIVTTWEKIGGPGIVDFGDPSLPESQVIFSEPGNYILRLSAYDGQLIGKDEVIITVIPRGGSTSNTMEVMVTSSSDDAEECLSNYLMYLTSSDLELVRDDNSGGGSLCADDQVVGIRFRNISIPKGATITNAYIQFQVDEASSETTTLMVYGEDSDDAGIFTSSSGDISFRPRTTAYSPWTPVAWSVVGLSGLDQRTPNIAPIIQEIVDRFGWSAGNAMAFFIEGSGQRIAESYDGDRAGAPLLHVDYTVNAANQPPVANAGPDQTVTDSDRNGTENVTLNGSGSTDADGTIVSYVWKEGGVTIASGVSPTVSLGVGVHTLTLQVTDNGGSTATDTVVITVQSPANQPPVANAGPDQTVTDSDRNGTENVTLNGSGSTDADGTIVSYVWKEGGGTIASGVSPTVSLGVGVHTLTLQVTDNGGSTATDTVVITVQSPATASFSATPRSGRAPLSVQFTDTSTGSIASWQWDFGDGTAGSTQQNPVHLYGAVGTYSVGLTVTGPGGSNSIKKAHYIRVRQK